jgi:hypothetical protein
MKTKSPEEMMLSKMRQPIHISYIAGNILKKTVEETKEYLDQLIEDGIVEESPLAPGYYGLKKK